MFKCHVKGKLGNGTVGGGKNVDEWTVVKLELDFAMDMTRNNMKEELEDYVKNEAQKNILYRIASKNPAIPKDVFWNVVGSTPDVEIAVKKRWIKEKEDENKSEQLALDL